MTHTQHFGEGKRIRTWLFFAWIINDFLIWIQDKLGLFMPLSRIMEPHGGGKREGMGEGISIYNQISEGCNNNILNLRLTNTCEGLGGNQVD